MERATLTGLMASGVNDKSASDNETTTAATSEEGEGPNGPKGEGHRLAGEGDEAEEVRTKRGGDDDETTNGDNAKKKGVRINFIVNDLVMVVENQHRIMQDLKRQSGLDIGGGGGRRATTTTQQALPDADDAESPTLLHDDENYSALLRLVSECARQSDEMLSVQNHIRDDFDINAFQRSMTMEEFWSGITVYMDQLHSLELYLLEELEHREGGFEDLDLLALGRRGRPPPGVVRAERSALLNDANGLPPPPRDDDEDAPSDERRTAIETRIGRMTRDELRDALISLLNGKEEEKGARPRSLQSSPAQQTTGGNERRRPRTRTVSDLKNRMGSSHDERPSLEEWEISLYEVEFHKRIGRGSAGTTYLGRYANQDVAVKVAATSDMGLHGWTAELTSLKNMHHTNIIRFLGAIYNPSPLTYCLVLEYCDGGDLSVALASCHTPPKFFTTVASGVASGLYYLHKKNYMHRDIKPSNVLISGDLNSGSFVAKLTDFGLAVALQNPSTNSGNGAELTAETGTYRYMAPEVIRHECYDCAADVFSFGMLMWEMLTRERPFESKSQIEAAGAVAIEGKRPPFPKCTPFAVQSLIEGCWTEKPDRRMKVESIITCLKELEGSAETSAWLAAPGGHPVYKAAESSAPSAQLPATTPANSKVKKKQSALKNSLFRKKKK